MFVQMKRIILHVLFWVAYLVQDTLLSFLADAALLSHLSVGAHVILSLQVCVAILLPKIILAYFILYYILDRIIKQQGILLLNILWLILASLAALLMYRAIFVYYVYPVAY